MIETSKIVIIRWSPELRAVIERARKLGPQIGPDSTVQFGGRTVYRQRISL
jgi:hypothetical protein